jgi:hypothetical protein
MEETMITMRAERTFIIEESHWSSAIHSNRACGWPVGSFRAQTWDKIRPTSQAAIAQPAPVKKPTQNQTPIW